MRWLLSLLLLSSFSCHHKEKWQYTAIRNTNPSYDMARLSYRVTSRDQGMLLTFVRQYKEIQAYLHVYTFEIPYYQDNPHLAKINIKTDTEAFSFCVDRLKGGQRLHLSSDACAMLTNLLKKYPEVIIEVGHYSQTFCSTTFNKSYHKLCNLPLYLMPEKIVSFELY